MEIPYKSEYDLNQGSITYEIPLIIVYGKTKPKGGIGKVSLLCNDWIQNNAHSKTNCSIYRDQKASVAIFILNNKLVFERECTIIKKLEIKENQISLYKYFDTQENITPLLTIRMENIRKNENIDENIASIFQQQVFGFWMDSSNNIDEEIYFMRNQDILINLIFRVCCWFKFQRV